MCYFLKFNQNKAGIIKEYLGLQLLYSYDLTPKLILHKEVQDSAFILMEYINQPKYYIYDFSSDFALKLAQLHQQKSSMFGLDYTNFIGSLSQDNSQTVDFMDHYINTRIGPQIKLAQNRGFLKDFQSAKFYSYVSQLIVEEQPCLIHGDLWNGNVVFGENRSYFIDPAVSYSHREFDIAMMHLFGGFKPASFERYNEIYPLAYDWEYRMPIFQLYYLLAHLNMFGKQYLNSVQEILRRN